jgi:hypothetical protein
MYLKVELHKRRKPARWVKAKFKLSFCVPLIVFADRMKNSDINKIKGHSYSSKGT